MGKYTKEQIANLGLTGDLPAHVAIIMDGNGRWAQARKLPRAMGHRAGMERLNDIIRHTSDLGIAALSMYAFSTENWKRPQEEIGVLCGLLVEYFKKEIDELHANHVCVRALGVQAPFPLAVREAVQEAERRTANNTGLKLNIALNYGAQNEWVRATQAIAQKVQTGALRIEDITETALADHLDTRGLPAVDLVIRTSGEQRLSNFMLYQAAYAELLFVKEGWPDFSLERYTAALQIFLKRTRRYGGL